MVAAGKQHEQELQAYKYIDVIPIAFIHLCVHIQSSLTFLFRFEIFPCVAGHLRCTVLRGWSGTANNCSKIHMGDCFNICLGINFWKCKHQYSNTAQVHAKLISAAHEENDAGPPNLSKSNFELLSKCQLLHLFNQLPSCSCA